MRTAATGFFTPRPPPSWLVFPKAPVRVPRDTGQRHVNRTPRPRFASRSPVRPFSPLAAQSVRQLEALFRGLLKAFSKAPQQGMIILRLSFQPRQTGIRRCLW